MDDNSLNQSELKLRIATMEDSPRLCQFFTSIPTLGAIDIKIEREEHFFSFYQRLGLPYRTYILENGSEILGTASFLLRELKFKNRTILLAQACDLRIASNRRAILNWSHFFTPLLEELRATENCDGFMTSINQTETQAMNAFIRPRQKRPHHPSYSLSRSYNLISIHGFYPWISKPSTSIRVRPYQASDKSKLIEYIASQTQNKDFLPYELHKSVSDFINRSLIYSWSQFLIAFDASDKIIGCVQPVSSSLLQNYLPQDYSPQAHNFRQFLKFAQTLGFARRLTRPFSRSHKQESLPFRLLHFLCASHPEVLKALLIACYKNSKQNEFLVYAYEDEDFAKRPPKGSIYADIPYGLYAIEPNSEEPLPELNLVHDRGAWLDFIWF